VTAQKVSHSNSSDSNEFPRTWKVHASVNKIVHRFVNVFALFQKPSGFFGALFNVLPSYVPLLPKTGK